MFGPWASNIVSLGQNCSVMLFKGRKARHFSSWYVDAKLCPFLKVSVVPKKKTILRPLSQTSSFSWDFLLLRWFLEWCARTSHALLITFAWATLMLWRKGTLLYWTWTNNSLQCSDRSEDSLQRSFEDCSKCFMILTWTCSMELSFLNDYNGGNEDCYKNNVLLPDSFFGSNTTFPLGI